MPLRRKRNSGCRIGEVLPLLFHRETGQTRCGYSTNMDILRTLVIIRDGKKPPEITAAASAEQRGISSRAEQGGLSATSVALPVQVKLDTPLLHLKGYDDTDYHQGCIYLREKRFKLDLNVGKLKMPYELARPTCRRANERDSVFRERCFSRLCKPLEEDRCGCSDPSCVSCPCSIILEWPSGFGVLHLIGTNSDDLQAQFDLPTGFSFTEINVPDDSFPMVELVSNVSQCTRATLEKDAIEATFQEKPLCRSCSIAARGKEMPNEPLDLSLGGRNELRRSKRETKGRSDRKRKAGDAEASLRSTEQLKSHTLPADKLKGHTPPADKLKGHTPSADKLKGHTPPADKLKGHTPLCLILRISHSQNVLKLVDHFIITYQSIGADPASVDSVSVEEEVVLVVFKKDLVRAYDLNDFRCQKDSSQSNRHVPSTAYPTMLYEKRCFDGKHIFAYPRSLLGLYHCHPDSDNHRLVDITNNTTIGEIVSVYEQVGFPKVMFDDRTTLRIKMVSGQRIQMFELSHSKGKMEIHLVKDLYFGPEKPPERTHTRSGRAIRVSSHRVEGDVPIVLSFQYENELNLYLVAWHDSVYSGIRVTLLDGDTFERVKEITFPIVLTAAECWSNLVRFHFDRNLLLIRRKNGGNYLLYAFDLVEINRGQSPETCLKANEILGEDGWRSTRVIPSEPLVPMYGRL